MLSYLNSNFALTLGYLKPALNSPAKGEKFYDRDQKVGKVEIYQFFNTVPIYAGMLIVI